MKVLKFLACLLVGACALITFSAVAAAHHNTVGCQSPGVWFIVNSEADKAESFTTSAGHTGTIPAGGSTTVAYSGTSLTVNGTWSNGTTHTDTGTGSCTKAPTTTIGVTPSTTSPSTTVAATSTTPTAPSTLPSVTTTSVPSAPFTTPPSSLSEDPFTTPPSTPPTAPSISVAPIAPPESAGAQLPATGIDDPVLWTILVAAFTITACGVVIVVSNRSGR